MSRWVLGLFWLMVTGCVKTPMEPTLSPPEAPTQAETKSDALRHYLDEVYAADLATNPVRQHYQGIKDQQEKWTLTTPEYRQARREAANKALQEMKAQFSLDTLDAQGRLNYLLFADKVNRMNDGYRWRHHGYGITQMHGTHAWIPSFLINVHQIENVVDAKAYIQRLRGVGAVVDVALKEMNESYERGVLPPAFVFPMVIDDCKNLLKGAPFDDSAPGPWLHDIQTKLGALDLPEDTIRALEADAIAAIQEHVGPAYTKLLESLTRLHKEATDTDGVWKLPDGDAYYAYRLQQTTTTDMSAEEIHQIGLDEVARIHTEMRAIQNTVGFEGTLSAFFEHLRTDPKYFYPNTAEGKAQYIQEAETLIRTIEAKLPEYFITTPKAPLSVKAVEAYREKSAGKAFYSRGTPDGSRPGTYYANLYDMNSMPIYQMEALAYHEGIPGHHQQNSIAQEIEGIARFRQFSGYTAYGEGWGLYSEYVPKEMGFYQDPYSDFGRLAMELWRACRLVVDTGIHAKKWTREEAIDYLMNHTPNPKRDAVKAIERYIVMPGQATGYKVGMLKILALRAKAKTTLGDAFDIREFHEVVLTNGPVPLDVLTQLVDEWISSKQATAVQQ